MSRVLRLAGAATFVGLALPATAGAHGLVGRADLPIPEWLFAWGAALVLIVSFVALSALWREPRLERRDQRPLFRIPAFVDVGAGLLGVVLFCGLVYAGFAGSQVPTENALPTFVYVLFWVGLPIASAVFGDVFRALSPWRAAARAIRWLLTRLGRDDLPEALPYPERLGRWPAVAGLLVFVWFELIPADGDKPSVLAILALLYAAVQFLGMALYGIDRWSERGDAFGVYFGLFARISPFARRNDGVAVLRRPLSGLTGLELLPGTVALLCVAIGSTAFDGAAEGELWNSIAPTLQDGLVSLGFGLETALELAFTSGLAAMILLVAALYGLGVAGMRSATIERDRPTQLAARFTHSLVPIALAYVLAHYFSLLVYQGQATAYLASDPLGGGADLLGTASSTIDYAVVSAAAIWYVQVGALVAGHVAGLTLAHDRALTVYERVTEATRSQYWMLAVMVGFTSLGLWLLSQANA